MVEITNIFGLGRHSLQTLTTAIGLFSVNRSRPTAEAAMQDIAQDRTATLAMLRELERKVLWLSTYMIHHANHEVDRGDGLKVGGHQASSASLATLDDGALFPRPAARGSHRGQAAREPDLSRDPVPARQPEARQAAELPRLRRRAILSLAHQGQGRRRFLDRLGRSRRRGDGVFEPHPGLRPRQGLERGLAEGAHGRADG